MPADHEILMRRAIAEAEQARGSTGDNPWVGCVIADECGELLGWGHTQGPGEDHAEIAAARLAHARGHRVEGATLYSTLEPCSFHGRTPACACVIVERGIRRVVLGMHDPHPRVDGEGVRILQAGGIEVIEGVCEAEVRRQLGGWVLAHHPHDLLRRARSLGLQGAELQAALAEIYALSPAQIEPVIAALGAAPA
jgi:diaminohydroxyphosphoribosylaminopyrimidine deaminase/5-amino-6-(5-phosphoribosylamino)uracil reductase